MEDLEEPLRWAVADTQMLLDSSIHEAWKQHLGTWLMGRSRIDEALNVLSDCKTDIGKVLLSRLWKIKGDNVKAVTIIRSLKERWVMIHPQVVVERDKILRALGKETLAERAQWLLHVAALEDEWVIERKVQLLIDQEKYHEAKDLLLTTRFQKVHQTYTRTALWRQLCRRLNLKCDQVPGSLGEDNLARFGAYREYE
jgi:hypothetical protein